MQARGGAILPSDRWQPSPGDARLKSTSPAPAGAQAIVQGGDQPRGLGARADKGLQGAAPGKGTAGLGGRQRDKGDQDADHEAAAARLGAQLQCMHLCMLFCVHAMLCAMQAWLMRACVRVFSGHDAASLQCSVLWSHPAAEAL